MSFMDICVKYISKFISISKQYDFILTIRIYCTYRVVSKKCPLLIFKPYAFQRNYIEYLTEMISLYSVLHRVSSLLYMHPHSMQQSV